MNSLVEMKCFSFIILGPFNQPQLRSSQCAVVGQSLKVLVTIIPLSSSVLSEEVRRIISFVSHQRRRELSLFWRVTSSGNKGWVRRTTTGATGRRRCTAGTRGTCVSGTRTVASSSSSISPPERWTDRFAAQSMLWSIKGCYLGKVF